MTAVTRKTTSTIITEWETGSSICQEMLQSTSVIDRVTTKLAQMALAYGFNGWLINIENKIEIDHIPGLQYFVHELTLKCRAMLDAPKVLWYDSVINTGELKWQNELNPLNEMFFQVCDGIFLNYCISNDHLSHSKMMAASYGRQFDVYVGVDAFGRGTPGGGGFNCREVMEMIQTHGLSCALFAPGWTYEKHPKEHFDVQEVMFWGLLNDRMSTRTVKVPFSTSFCRGYGNQYFLEGQSLSESPWYNLCVQQIQPSFTQSQFYRYILAKTVRQVTEKTGEAKEEIDVKVHSEVQHPANPSMDFDVSCGYIGGGCLKLFAERIQSQAVCFNTFLVSSSKFIEAGYKDNLFILSAILVPCDNVGALNSCMTVHIGHITVHEYHTALFPRPSLNNMLCWTLKADLPLSIDDMHKILINPYLNINLQNTKTPPSTEESSISFNTDSVSKSQGSISVSSFSAQNCDIVSSLQSALSQSSSELSNPIYILKWSYSSSMNIDYILVSSYDQSGQRKLLGQTVGEKFVYVPSNDDNKLVSFSIQPIFPFANSIGDEQFYKLG
uniref:Cytosolic endo-beta-N-acetylglucosaminidase TIM barrel domain-containing protein n=1 Tax=Biomphalaria glabrata TaxID=6526 RepID=A0A2C9JG15_BIOGL